MKKYLIAMLFCIGFLSTFCLSNTWAADAPYPKWTKDENGWKLLYQDGSHYKNDWFYDVDTDIWYYMQDNGYVLRDAISPDGMQVSRSGRLIHPKELMHRIYHDEITSYQNSVFRFHVNVPKSMNATYFGVQNSESISDTDTDGGVQVYFYPGYRLDIYGTLYTPVEPKFQEAETFLTYSGLRGKIFIENHKQKKYISAQVYGPTGIISANVIDGIPESEYVSAKIALLKLLRSVYTIK